MGWFKMIREVLSEGAKLPSYEEILESLTHTYTTTSAGLWRPRGWLVCPQGHTINEDRHPYEDCPAVIYYSRNRRTKKGWRQPSRGVCHRALRSLEDHEKAALELGGVQALRAILPKPKAPWQPPEKL